MTVLFLTAGGKVDAMLIGDYRFAAGAPLANEIAAGLPDIRHEQFNAEAPPLLTGQEIPAGGRAAPANGWALAWTRRVPQVGFDRWILSECRVPQDPGLALGGRFTLWMRVLYGGSANGGGYSLLTLDGADGEQILLWGTDDRETDLVLKARLRNGAGDIEQFSCRSTGTGVKLRNSRWYDAAVAFDRGRVTFFATALGRNGPETTETETVVLGADLAMAAGSGPFWILRGTNSAVESLRIYRDEALSAEAVQALSAGVRVPGPKPVTQVTVGKERQLLFDDAVIAALRGSAVRRLGRVQKYPGNPVVRKTQSDEIEGLGPTFWGTVLYDREERVFKMWHAALTFKPPEIFNHLYAVSKDGLRWEKPILNVVGTDNRHKPPGYKAGHAGMWLSVRQDAAAADPQQRYKAFIQHDPLYYLSSADGLQWTEHGAAAYYTDDTTCCVYHPGRREYLKTGRFCPDGHNIALRSIMTCVAPTPAAAGNTPWHLVMLPDDADLQRDPDLQFYHMPGFAYESIYVSLLGIYHAGPDNGNSEHELAFSRDGLNWQRVAHGTLFMERGAPGSWDSGFGVVPSGGPVEVGDELWFYYSCYNASHHAVGSGRAGIGLARLRRDGFVSLSAGADGGAVLTKPFELAGSVLEINARVRGSLRVRVLDESRSALAASAAFQADDCHHIVRWAQRRDLGAFQGKTVQLEFDLEDADLYAFQVSGPEEVERRRKAREERYRPADDPWGAAAAPESAR